MDSDCDGLTSSAILLNYLHKLFPYNVEYNFEYRLHNGKQHGLIYDTIPKDVKLVIAPDSSSSDYDVHLELYKRGVDVLILDHHEADVISPYACVINNQLCNYPNKDLSGAGVVLKFCQYIDKLLNKHEADNYFDLAALGIIADVMDLRELETREILTRGMAAIKNPLLSAMTEKQSYVLGDQVTPTGLAFYIAPYLNAICRSGSDEEKLLIFESMLEYKAYEQIPSTKRGFKGTYEERVEQACRTCTNVKKHQDDNKKTETEEVIENINNDCPIIVITKEGLNRNLAGLIATQISNKFQRPTMMLTETGDGLLEGSCRGYGIDSFKDFLLGSNLVEYCTGHANAFGCGIKKNNLEQLKEYARITLEDYDFSIKYKVDGIYKQDLLDTNDILTIASYDNIWGKGIEEPLIAIEGLKITDENIKELKGNTVKIDCGQYEMIKFKDEEMCKNLIKNDGKTRLINIVGKCSKNEWNGIITPQIKIEDYEIIKEYYDF